VYAFTDSANQSTWLFFLTLNIVLGVKHSAEEFLIFVVAHLHIYHGKSGKRLQPLDRRIYFTVVTDVY
jgi:hypothetical protein